MPTKTTKKTPGTSKKSTAPVAKMTIAHPAPGVTVVTNLPSVTDKFVKVDADGLPRATQAQFKQFQLEGQKVAMTTILPGLIAKYGPANPPAVEGVKYVVDKNCLNDYTAAKGKLIREMVSRAGLSPKSMLVVDITPEEEAAMSKTPDAPPATTTTTTPAKAPKHKVITTAHGEFRDNSVLLNIYRAFDLKGGATKEEILARLVKAHPDRKPDDMMVTINTQLNRMPKDRSFTIGRDDKGRYGIHIVGHSKVRILSPEAALKKAEADKLREAAKAVKETEKAAKKAAKKAEKLKATAEKAEAKAKEDAEKAKAAAEKAAADLKAKGVTVNVPGATVSKAPAAATTKKK